MREGPEIDLGRAAAWLGTSIEVEGHVLGGASNSTWFVRVGEVPAVLRHPPSEVALPTAHDLARERRYLLAVRDSEVRVPNVMAFCEDAAVAGLPFLILERLPGVCLLRSPLGDLDAIGLARSAVEILAALHGIDWRARGLEGRPGSYLGRQVDRWKRQLERTPTASRLSRLDEIHGWLRENLPKDEDQTLVHGDFGFHNLLVDGQGIRGVLDWELATIGDPLSDLAGMLKGWGADSAVPNPAHHELTLRAGAPGVDRLVGWYEEATGRSFAEKRVFYDILGIWKSIGILEGIHARTEGRRFASEVPALAVRVATMIERLG